MLIKMFEKNIYVKNTEKYGKSIFAKRNFKKEEEVFIICGPIVKKPTIYTVPISFDLFIDPLPLAGKELCHSCEPNCGIKNRNVIVAMKNIKKDEEITIDYAMIVPKYNSRVLKQNTKCNCGSKNCRGKFGSYQKLSEELKRKYKGFISEYLTEK
jgi:uncharacterized protein